MTEIDIVITNNYIIGIVPCYDVIAHLDVSTKDCVYWKDLLQPQYFQNSRILFVVDRSTNAKILLFENINFKSYSMYS